MKYHVTMLALNTVTVEGATIDKVTDKLNNLTLVIEANTRKGAILKVQTMTPAPPYTYLVYLHDNRTKAFRITIAVPQESYRRYRLTVLADSQAQALRQLAVIIPKTTYELRHIGEVNV